MVYVLILCLVTMIPIPKDKRKSLDCSDNYRAITLGGIVSKNIRLCYYVKGKVSLKHI